MEVGTPAPGQQKVKRSADLQMQ
jgi:clathrin heavy chain